MTGGSADRACVELLQWALPQLRMRWPGFRKVRGQVCKRLRRRMRALDIDSMAAYRSYLEAHPEEWPVLDAMCQISISRFFRDRGVFACLQEQVLPELARGARQRGATELRAWCAGCASGEEPYALAILWRLGVQERFADLSLRILATDVNRQLLERARAACYGRSSLKELPQAWRVTAFEQAAPLLRVRSDIAADVEFRLQDLRKDTPAGTFDLVLCRNLAFTYFARDLQMEILERLCEHLRPGGALVIGSHERLPALPPALGTWSEQHRVYRRAQPAGEADA